MYNIYNSNPILKNCIFFKNSTPSNGAGGGLFNYSSNPMIIGCTFARNSAGWGWGGAMYINGGNPTITNCIIWTNSSAMYVSAGTPIVTYTDIQDGWYGIGNINLNPRFFYLPDGSTDLQLLPNSPCINTGDPNFVPEPNETDIDGEPRVMLSRVDMGADEFNPFEIDFTIIHKRRIGRTTFEYDCAVSLTNISRFTVSNVSLEIIKASENMVIVDPAVTFGVLEIGPGESALSSDMCTFRLDRSQSTDPAEIIWKSTCEMVDGSSGVQDIASGVYFLNLAIIPGDINRNNKVDFEDLKILTDQWLQPPGTPSADIAPLPTGDSFVDFLDFALLAQNWLRASGD
jgi:hypothetical protein